MSGKEISRLEVMQKLSEKRMSQKEAGAMLGVSERHIKRLLKAYRKKGASGLVSKHRGRKGNHCLPAETKRKALDLLESKYKGFGPTLAHEKLVEKENLKLSDESVRQLMIVEGLWNWCRLMAPHTTGSKGEQKRVCYWYLLMTPAGSCCNCFLWKARVFSVTALRQMVISGSTANRLPSTAINMVLFGSTPLRWDRGTA
jgi:transposase